MFWRVEKQTGLYMFFKTVCDVYTLIPEDNYTIPPEAEGREPDAEEITSLKDLPIILNRSKQEEKKNLDPVPSTERVPDLPTLANSIPISTGHTTKRHRQTPSVDSGVISTVLEDPEEDDGKSIAESVVTTVPEGESSLAESLAQMNAPKISTREITEPALKSPENPEKLNIPVKEHDHKDITGEIAAVEDETLPEKKGQESEQSDKATEDVPILLPTSEVSNVKEAPKQLNLAEKEPAEPQKKDAETVPKEARTEADTEVELPVKQPDENKSATKTESTTEGKSKD
jgi:hypothetical protein